MYIVQIVQWRLWARDGGEIAERDMYVSTYLWVVNFMVKTQKLEDLSND